MLHYLFTTNPISILFGTHPYIHLPVSPISAFLHQAIHFFDIPTFLNHPSFHQSTQLPINPFIPIPIHASTKQSLPCCNPPTGCPSTNPFIHPLVSSVTPPPIHPFIYQFTNTTQSVDPSIPQPFCPFIHSSLCQSVHPFLHPLVSSVIPPPIHPFIYQFTNTTHC